MKSHKKKKNNKKGESALDLNLTTQLDKNTIINCFNFIKEDCLDTYKELVEKKWNTLTKQEKKIIKKKEIHVQNKNIGVMTLQAINQAFIKQLEELIKLAKENHKKLLPIKIEEA